MMKLIVDEDVAKVAEFMRLNIDAIKLQRVARALVQLGELIWPEQYPEDRYLALDRKLALWSGPPIRRSNQLPSYLTILKAVTFRGMIGTMGCSR